MTIPFNQPNDRIFWACQGVLISERNTESGTDNPTSATFLTGVQSVGVSSSPSATSLLNIGRMQKKITQYNQTNYEITLERRIDKNSNFFYNVASGQYTDYKSSHILNSNNLGFQGMMDSNSKCLRSYDITLLYRPDRFSSIKNVVSGSDPDKSDVISNTYKNCLITNISYSIATDSISESITLTTNNMKYNDDYSDASSYALSSLPESGDTLKKQDIDILLGSPKSILPLEVEQIFDLGNSKGDKKILAIQSIDISIGVDYSALPDIGIWRGSIDGKEYEQNRWKSINLPLDITCSFRGIARQAMPFSSFLDSSLNKIKNVDNIFTKSLGSKTSTDWQEADREIRIVAIKNISGTDNYFVWDLGSSNYLTELSYSGGEAGGENVEATISYRNDFNDAVLTKTTSVINLSSSKIEL